MGDEISRHCLGGTGRRVCQSPMLMLRTEKSAEIDALTVFGGRRKRYQEIRA
jgi:hypothetical protein